MNYKFYLLLVLLACAAKENTQAQEIKHLSLGEAISLSLQNSKHLQISAAVVEEAGARLQEAKNMRLPDAKLSAAYLRVNQPTVDLKVKPAGNSTSSGAAPAAVVVNQASYLLANALLPLFAGFKINAGIESARYLSKAAQLNAESQQDEVIYNTIAAYANLYKAGTAVSLVQENLKQQNQRLEDFGNMEKNGLLARNDLLKAQLQKTNVELALLDAQSNLEMANLHMNLMLGLAQSTVLSLDSAELVNLPANKTATQWENLALQNRREPLVFNLNTKAAKAGVKAVKGDYFPALALTGGMVAINVPNLLSVSNALNAGLGFSYSPSSLWKNGAKVKEAQARLAQLEAQEMQLSENIILEIHQAYQNYIVNLKKIEVYASALNQAKENFKISKNKYNNSLLNTADLLDADVAQFQAQLNYLYARAEQQ